MGHDGTEARGKPGETISPASAEQTTQIRQVPDAKNSTKRDLIAV